MALYILDSGETWIRWITNTLKTEAVFVAEVGDNHPFRVTGRDRVGNAGVAEETVEVFNVTKYYTFNGQRVAMRKCANTT